MLNMETDLKNKNEALWNAYQQSYDIALKQWLPLVANNNNSSNALPHLIGVKERIDELLYSGKYCEIQLNAIELYCLLCAVLMHDIGKASCFKKQKDSDHKTTDYLRTLGCGCADAKGTDTDHHAIANYVIKSRWHNLGILNEKIARIIGLICCFHDCKLNCEGKESQRCKALHNNFFIDGYDRIRARVLGALLYLGDHLDDTFKRTSPKFLSEISGIEEVCKFRDQVQYIRIDKENKMICSVLDKSYIRDDDYSAEAYISEIGGSKKYEYICINHPIREKSTLNTLFDYLTKYNTTRQYPYQFERNIEDSPMASLVAHVNENDTEIKGISNDLYILNMPIKEWLIECDGHLFRPKYSTKDSPKDRTEIHNRCRYRIDCDKCLLEEGEMRYFVGIEYAWEPKLDQDFLNRVYNAMVTLSECVFGMRTFTYYDILNYILRYTEDLECVKTAVNRIKHILDFYYNMMEHQKTEKWPKDTKALYDVYCNENIWMLKHHFKDTEKIEYKKDTYNISNILEAINKEGGQQNGN